MRNDFMTHQFAAQTARLALVFAFAFVFFSSVTIAAQQQNGLSKPEISIHADRNSVQIADPFDVVIQVVTNDGASVRFPTVPPQLGRFEVIDHRNLLAVPSEANNGTNKSTQRLTLETLETGNLTIPSIEVVVRSEGKPPLRLATEPLAIKVASVLEPASDPEKFADIRDLIDAPEPRTLPFGWPFWLAVAGLGLIALIAAAVYIFRGRTKWTTPVDWAVSEISDLTSNSPQSFAQLEHIVRTYLEQEIHVPATSYSPLELQHTILQRGANQDAARQLGDFLTKAEQAKYAGLDMSGSQFNAAKESVLQIIRELDSIPVDTSLGNNIVTTNVEVV